MPGLEMESTVKKTATTAAAHPKVSVMVETAIGILAERKGSSLQAINKYIGANYTVDVQKLSVFIKKFLKSAVERGDLIQTSGKGATGSFKINKKAGAKPKNPKVQSGKQLKMRTSTPKKTLKPKKASTKSPDKSPVKKLTYDQDMPFDSTFTKPRKLKKPRFSVPSKSRKSKNSLTAKIKKPKKLMVKAVNEPEVAGSSKGKSEITATSPKLAKAKAKKSSKPKNPAASNLKKAVVKKRSADDGHK